MSTKTPEGTTIIHALATCRALARRIADTHFTPLRMRQEARALEAVFADVKVAVTGLEGRERRVSPREMSEAIVGSLTEMAKAGLIDSLEEHRGYPPGGEPAHTVTVSGPIDLINLVHLIQVKLRKDA